MVHEEETSVDLSQTEGYDDAVQPNPEYTAHIIESDGLLAEKLAEKLTDTRSSSISIFISSLLSIAGAYPIGSSTPLHGTSTVDLPAALKSESGIDDLHSGDDYSDKEYTDTLKGRMSLSEVWLMIHKYGYDRKTLFDDEHLNDAKNECYKNILAISAAAFLLYSSAFAMRSAQSSIGDDKQLLLLAYSCTFALLWLGGICTNPAVYCMTPRWTMIATAIGLFIYPVSQFYPSPQTLIPAALIVGLAIGLLFGTSGFYVTNVAKNYALISGESLSTVVGRLNSIFYSFFMGANIMGNMIGSLILGNLYTFPEEKVDTEYYAANTTTEPLWQSPMNDTPNATCGLDFYKNAISFSEPIYVMKAYIFYAANAFLIVVGAILMGTLVKNHQVVVPTNSRNPLSATIDFLKVVIDRKCLLMAPFMLYFGITGSLMLADFNAAYVTCQFGADKVGYVVAVSYTFSVLGSISSHKLMVLIGRIPLITIGFCISMGALISMLIWRPSQVEISVLAFLPGCLWGLSEGLLFTQCVGYMTLLFQRQAAQAINAVNCYYAVSQLLGSLAITYTVFSLTTKVYITMGLNVVSTIAFVILHISRQKDML